MKIRPLAVLALVAALWVGGLSVCTQMAQAADVGRAFMSSGGCALTMADGSVHGPELVVRHQAPGTFVPDCCFMDHEDDRSATVLPVISSFQPATLPTDRVLPPKVVLVSTLQTAPPEYNLKLFDIGSTVKRE